MTRTCPAASVESVTLSDGRMLTFSRYGDAGGNPVLYLHGAGSSRIDGEHFHRDARSTGVQIIATDRPGCGGSSPAPNRTFLSYARDLEEFADKLGIGRFVVAGQSNGGVYAMAAAWRLKDRIIKVIPINASTPIRDVLARKVTPLTTRLAYRLIGSNFGIWLSRRATQLMAGSQTIQDISKRTLIEALRQPESDYLEREIQLASAEWGFDHTAITQPVDVFTGDRDAGYPYAVIWAQLLPAARLHVFSGGHVDYVAPDVSARIVKAMNTESRTCSTSAPAGLGRQLPARR